MAESIVPMSTEHLEPCVELYMKVFNSEPWNESWTPETAKERLADLMHTPHFMGFFWENHGTPIGFIAGHRKVTDQGPAFYLAELCINNAIQGKGYGSQLLRFLEEQLRKNNVKSLYLLTSHGGPAESFYRKNGYAVHHNRMVMGKKL
ncbi:GNAT family N-acetyltransferase [Caenibacillus caldisaponilyticus]|uniref:GNAT family N-acetyltransferase n=1 Tax=Caenibacillus caldisaponilyticus TaxID=1674942 RepID=UPI00098859AE|nr:GNAT family N-acetyltransferase [Caenibacillus caldisaponilyticus]